MAVLAIFIEIIYDSYKKPETRQLIICAREIYRQNWWKK